jgi:ribosome-binding protein aMBF1 (putative translation factor)
LKAAHSDRYTKFLSVMTDTRIKLELSQSELARVLKKPQSHVSKYERGERRLDVIAFIDLRDVLELNTCAVLRKVEGNEKNLDSRNGTVDISMTACDVGPIIVNRRLRFVRCRTVRCVTALVQ